MVNEAFVGQSFVLGPYPAAANAGVKPRLSVLSRIGEMRTTGDRGRVHAVGRSK
jgi:hypothetical protein